MKNRVTIIALGAGMILATTAAFASQPSKTGTLRVVVDGLSSSQPVRVGLWKSKSGFLSTQPFKGVKKAVDDGKAVWVIKNLPYGAYAVSGWQDLNGNGKMDMNSYHAPVEPSGVSNNAKGRMGPPAYEDAAFKLDKPTMTVTFELACPMGCESQ